MGNFNTTLLIVEDYVWTMGKICSLRFRSLGNYNNPTRKISDPGSLRSEYVWIQNQVPVPRGTSEREENLDEAAINTRSNYMTG